MTEEGAAPNHQEGPPPVNALCQRPGCPSDAAYWKGYFNNTTILASEYTCLVCTYQWTVYHQDGNLNETP